MARRINGWNQFKCFVKKNTLWVQTGLRALPFEPRADTEPALRRHPLVLWYVQIGLTPVQGVERRVQIDAKRFTNFGRREGDGQYRRFLKNVPYQTTALSYRPRREVYTRQTTTVWYVERQRRPSLYHRRRTYFDGWKRMDRAYAYAEPRKDFDEPMLVGLVDAAIETHLGQPIIDYLGEESPTFADLIHTPAVLPTNFTEMAALMNQPRTATHDEPREDETDGDDDVDEGDDPEDRWR